MNSQKAVENFYQWEIKGRGYLLYPYPVKIEPKFREFYQSFDNTEYVDDGKVPRLFERLFSNNTPVANEESYEEKPSKPYEYSPSLVQLKICFPEKHDFKSSLSIEFLNMLSDSKGQISFEIIGKHDNLEIQLVCHTKDHKRILHLLKAYFPNSIVTESGLEDFPFEIEKEILIADFGYNEEFMRPINTSIDALTSVMSTFENLFKNDVAMLQIIFKEVKKPWVRSIVDSVGVGANSFFPDSPEMVPCVKAKVSSPLFAVVFRVAVQSNNSKNAQRLANELILNVRAASRSEFNSLIPLSNEGYEYESHLQNLILRGTNRFGMIMNSQELFPFVHFPNSPKLISCDSKTKAVPPSLIGNKYLIGINSHLGIEKRVTLSDAQRLRHTHIIGATGTGKSTLISNLFLEDIRCGNGCAIFDPHGDTIDEIMDHIPQGRLKGVILIDPSDNEYAFGFNLLSANTDVEKIVLSSDLVEAFRRHSTSWGDQMTSVLSNAINTFLYSKTGGTLVELRRFLIEDSFRKEFLKSVNDRSIHYYWNNEFKILKRLSISPLLTRLDTFLRPKIIRNILSQKQGLDFNEVINERKILLVKLSQGLIGEANSYLLGTLILAKIYQVAQARQLLPKDERPPFYIYLDEFQNFITPSINAILSGARKYGIGLVLAHQDLNQIRDLDIGNSILANANIRLCFRLGDLDARKLESGFASFENSDLQNLNVGEAIGRVGKNTDDFSLRTFLLKQTADNENRRLIVQTSREKYSKRISEIEDDLNLSLSDNVEQRSGIIEEIPKKKEDIPVAKSDIEEKGKEYLENFKEKEEVREHRYLQTFIKKIAEQRGFKASIEEIVENGRIDVALVKDSIKIACEIAVFNSVEYEFKNICKCLNSKYSLICVVSNDEKHLDDIKGKVVSEIEDKEGIFFYTPKQMSAFLDSLMPLQGKEMKRIRGYRVKVNYRIYNPNENDE